MPVHITTPARILAAGNLPKEIAEFFGLVSTGNPEVSIALMRSPSGWEEPGQTPEFDEYSLVLKGRLRVEHAGGVAEVGPGEAVMAAKGEWVRYSTPGPEGAEYVSVCIPAFSPQAVHRDT